MHHRKSFRLLAFSIILIVISPFCKAQERAIELTDSTGLRTYSVGSGDTVLVRYDSAYILNKRIFKLYQDNYRRVQSGNPSLKKLLDEYEHLLNFQDSMLKEKEKYYQGLKTNFDSLVTTSNRFADRTDMNITAINQSLSNASSQLNNIKTLLDDSLEKLKLVNRQKFKWALGGFTVGIGVATVIFLIAK